MNRVIVFDVNETLLDLRSLDQHFERIFGDASIRRQWFGLVLRNAMALTIAGDYKDFVEVGGASLDMVAAVHGIEVTDDDRTAIRGGLTSLPPHPEVPGALRRLHDAGLTLAALTNSPQQAAETQLENAGVAELFDSIMSVAGVRKFKPAPEVYAMAATQLDVSSRRLRLVAAHDWDIAGAMAVGWAGAFVTRPGMVLNPLFEAPDIVGSDLAVVADQILRIDVA